MLKTGFAAMQFAQFLRLFALAFSAALVVQPANAQTYPTRAIKIVVPATPGGAIDIIARSLAEKMTASLG